jgi:hypothetical protein
MVDLRSLLLPLGHVICERPPPIFLSSSFAAAVSDRSSTIPFQHVINTTAEQWPPARARAPIRGERITEEWLHHQKDTDVLWRFRYVATYSFIIMMQSNIFQDGHDRTPGNG